MKIQKLTLRFAVLLSVILSSCDSDDVKVIGIPEGVNTTLQVDALNGIYSLPVESENEWSAAKNGSDNWIYFISDNGIGDGNITFSLSTNLTEKERTATIRISDETGSVDYTIKQPPYTGDGENSAEDVKYANSGLGQGLYINSTGSESDVYDFMAGLIFNFSEMDNPLVSKLGDFVNVRQMSKTDCITKNFAQKETASTDVSADLSVNVKYGLFSMDLKGNFHMFGEKKDTVTTWGASTSVPLAQYTLQYASITGNYPWKETKDSTYNAIRACLFSAEFLNLQDEIERLALEGKTADDPEMAAYLDYLDDRFGPAFIKSVKKGGVVDFDFQRSTSSSNDTLSIGGSLTVGFNSLFSVNVAASADYLRTAHSITEGGTLQINVSGGNQATHGALIAAVGSICNKEYDIELILNKISEWSSTITLDNSEISDITISGIWSLFSSKSSNIVKNYLKSKYPNDKKEDGSVSCPYMYNLQIIR